MGLLILGTVPDYSTFGTNALITFRNSCVESIGVDRGNAALYRLLADHTDRLIDAYHQVPLDSDIARKDFEHFRSLVAAAANAADQTAEQQVEALNSIAAADFF
jgi:hypothetical protein